MHDNVGLFYKGRNKKLPSLQAMMFVIQDAKDVAPCMVHGLEKAPKDPSYDHDILFRRIGYPQMLEHAWLLYNMAYNNNKRQSITPEN